MSATPNRHRLRHVTRQFLAATSIALAVGALAACGDDEPTDTTVASTVPSSTSSPTGSTTPGSSMPPESTTAIANPASEFCVHSGGTIEIVDEAGGQVGYCVLPDGTRVEEWDYFNNTASTTTAP